MSRQDEAPQEEVDDVVKITDEIKETQDPKRKFALALKLAAYEPEMARPLLQMLDPTVVDTKDVITLKLGDKEFSPLVAYAIFPADLVRGFRKPRLLIEFDAVSLLPFVQFTAAEKVDPDAPEPVEILKTFLPEETVYEDREAWVSQRLVERKKLEETPFPELFKVDTNSVSLLRFGENARQTAFLRRMLVFSWFFIEGARLPDESDTTWQFYVLRDSDQGFLGYASIYVFLYYTTGQEFEAEGANAALSRSRIAQFVILPPFQRQGLGSGFYLALLDYFKANPNIKEIEVEDPSTEFELLRDRSHYKWLTGNPQALQALNDYADNSEESLAKLYSMHKLAQVQFQRVAEMFIFMEGGQKESRTLKKLIKSRLWKRNWEALRDMDPQMQRTRLISAYDGVLHTHKVALGLEKPDEEEDDENEDDSDEGNASAHVDALLSSFGALPPPKRRKAD